MTMTQKITTAVRAASLLGIAVLFALVTIPYAFGANIVKADVPFPFHVGAKTLPAGEYEFRIDLVTSMVTVVSSSKGSSTMAPFLTTLAATPHSNATDAHVVFDKVGAAYTLSELWQPGEDGILMHVTKGKYEHHVLHVKL
jgi:beta-xylosidase